MTDEKQGSDPQKKQPPKNSPWGQKPQGHKGSQPDLDLILKGMKDRLFNEQDRGGLGYGGGQRGNGGHQMGGQLPPFPIKDPVKLMFAALGLVIFLWLINGFYRVLPEENAVILTFGEWTDTHTAPGLGYHLPWPIQTVQKVNVTNERRIPIGFRDRGASGMTGADVAEESLMLTGDENIIDIDFVVTWRIADAGKFLFSIRAPEETIKKVAESAMREVIGRTKIQSALTEGRTKIEIDTKDVMQKMLDEYQSGVVINQVQLQKVDPPTQVVDAFNDVQRARADKERLKNEADTYRNSIVPKARGEAQKIINEANGYKQAVISRATGDAARFNDVYKAYSQAKDVTTKRIYLETMETILANSNKLIIGDAKSGSGVLPYLPLDKLMQNKTPQPAAPKP